MNLVSGWKKRTQAIATRVSTGTECSIIIEDGYTVKKIQMILIQTLIRQATKNLESRWILMFEIIKGKIFLQQKQSYMVLKESASQHLRLTSLNLSSSIQKARLKPWCKTFRKPTSWQMLLDMVQYVKDNKPCKTLVIDTMDWQNSYAPYQYVINTVKRYWRFWLWKWICVRERGNRRILNLLRMSLTMILMCVSLPTHKSANLNSRKKRGLRQIRTQTWQKTGSKQHQLLKNGQICYYLPTTKFFLSQPMIKENTIRHRAEPGNVYVTQSCWDAKNRFGLPKNLTLIIQKSKNIIEHENSLQSTTDRIHKPKIIERKVK